MRRVEAASYTARYAALKYSYTGETRKGVRAAFRWLARVSVRDWTGPCARYHTRPRGCSHDRLIRHLEPSSDRSAGCGEVCGPREGERREGSTAVEGGRRERGKDADDTLRMQAHQYANIAQRDHVDRAPFPTSSLATRSSRDGIVEAVTGCYTF